MSEDNSNVTILTVDDDAEITNSIKDLISSKVPGWKVLEANGGKECLETLSKKKVDVVLLDIMMPHMSGWEVAAKIKKKEFSVPIIFLTALGDNLSRSIGKLTADGYIEKPFNPDNLIGMIKEKISS